jgi:hypothetical protein
VTGFPVGAVRVPTTTGQSGCQLPPPVSRSVTRAYVSQFVTSSRRRPACGKNIRAGRQANAHDDAGTSPSGAVAKRVGLVLSPYVHSFYPPTEEKRNGQRFVSVREPFGYCLAKNRGRWAFSTYVGLDRDGFTAREDSMGCHCQANEKAQRSTIRGTCLFCFYGDIYT